MKGFLYPQDARVSGAVLPLQKKGLANALTWLETNVADNGEYTIVLGAGETLSPKTLSDPLKKFTVTLKSSGAPQLSAIPKLA
jgi:hypothetical protein